MSSFNKVILIGNLGHTPEVKQLPSGKSVSNLSLAVNERRTQKDGTTKETTTWVEVTVFDKQADAVGKHLSKGSAVLIEGRLAMREWTDKKSGQKRTKLYVMAERVNFLGEKQDGSRSSEMSDVPPEKPTERKDPEPRDPTQEREALEAGPEDNLPF